MANNDINKNEEIEDLGDIKDSGLVDREKNNNSQKKIVLVLAFIVIAILLITQLFSVFKGSDKTEDQKKPENSVDVVTRDNFNTKPEKKDDVKVFNFGNQSDIEEETEDKPPMLLGETSKVTFEDPKPKGVRKSSSGFMVKVTNNSDNQYITADSEYTNSNPDSMIGGNGGNDIFNAPAFKPEIAQKSPYNPHLLLSQGTIIPCSLRGRLVSNVGGQISCIIADNVLSSSGAVVLIEKGSIINGFYEGNSVERGHNEIFVVWQEARTPNNLIIPLFSGSTDPLGANGLTGWVDNHFWQRFGNAMMLSLFKDVTGALSQNLTQDSKQNYLQNSQNDATELTAEIIKRTGDIEPTLYKNQGDKINIFVARDIDFSNVYTLKRNFRK